nr:unnamed protein product [Callosobruchus chinensis]
MNILVNESPVNTSNKLRQNIINAAKQIIQAGPTGYKIPK